MEIFTISTSKTPECSGFGPQRGNAVYFITATRMKRTSRDQQGLLRYLERFSINIVLYHLFNSPMPGIWPSKRQSVR